ncbi:MAG: hypothetical protein QOK40_1410 [Miltoncostaeaceae bacterium]|nr:hypothetical protein [Miltoncostaeaceae bacterium]
MSDVARPRLSQAAGLPALAAAAARSLGGVVIGGGLGAAAWLVVMQDGYQRGFFGRRWSDQDFASALGKLAGASQGIIRQRGFYVTLVVVAAVMVLYGVVAHVLASRLPQRWQLHALGLGAFVFLLWGLVFSPIVSAREPSEKGGVFGIDAGGTTWLVALLASMAFAVVAVRIYRLMTDEGWWIPGRRKIEASATLEAMGVGDAEKDALTSLELAEELREKP